jgi:hypothetical protein
MEEYTDAEREYHSDIIQDTIDVVEKRKPTFEFPIEEHVDLLISYDAQVSLMSGMEDLIHTEEYTELYNKSQEIVQYLVQTYQKTSILQIEPYYQYCKIIEQMMLLISTDTAESQDELSKMFDKMTM